MCIANNSTIKNSIVSANWRTVLCVVLSAVANLREVWLCSEYWTAKPNCVALHHILGDIAFNLSLFSSHWVILFHSFIDSLLKLLLQSSVEIFKQGATTRQNDVVVQLNTILHRTQLNSIVNHLFNRFLPIFVNKFLSTLVIKLYLLGGRTFQVPKISRNLHRVPLGCCWEFCARIFWIYLIG
jgi:hypothetical protein